MWKSIFGKIILVVVLSVFLVQLNVGSALADNAPDIDQKSTNNRPLPERQDLSGSEVPASAPKVLPNSPAEASPEGAEDLSDRLFLNQIQEFDDEVYGDD